jgi:signal transduction histidine kinase
MKRFLLFFAICFLAIRAFGQSPQIDSLKHRVYTSKGDKEKLKAMLDVCARFETLATDTLWNYAVKAKLLAAKLRDAPSQGMAIVAQANAYIAWDNIDSAKALVDPELLKFNAADPTIRDIYFALRHLQLNFISGTSDYENAIAEAYRIIREAEKYKDSLAIADSFNSISIYKYDFDLNTQAVSLALKGLAYTSASPRYTDVIINISGNLSEYYNYIGKLDSAMYYADRTYNISKSAGYLRFESWALQKKSATYLKQKLYQKAADAILESMRLDRMIDGDQPRDDNLVALADVYNETHQFDKAIKVINDGVAFYNKPQNISPHARHGAVKNGMQRIYLYKMLARSYRLKGDSKHYEFTLERIITGLDSFYTKNSVEAIADYETKYQVQKKEATIAQQQLALVRENYLFYGSILVAILGAAVAVLVSREVRRKQRLKLKQLKEEERIAAEKAVAEAEETERRRIAADLHDNLGAQLSFIKRNVNFIIDQPAGFSPEDEMKYLNSVNDIAQNAIIDLRETIWVLNKDEVSIQEFADKLKSYMKQQLVGRENIRWHFKEAIHADWKLSSGEVMHLFRIVQEVISNIIKHSGADEINIYFESYRNACYRFEIIDNGNGFDMGATFEGHYGLENIGQRANDISATLSINSYPGEGTSVELQKQPG